MKLMTIPFIVRHKAQCADNQPILCIKVCRISSKLLSYYLYPDYARHSRVKPLQRVPLISKTRAVVVVVPKPLGPGRGDKRHQEQRRTRFSPACLKLTPPQAHPRRSSVPSALLPGAATWSESGLAKSTTWNRRLDRELELSG